MLGCDHIACGRNANGVLTILYARARDNGYRQGEEQVHNRLGLWAWHLSRNLRQACAVGPQCTNDKKAVDKSDYRVWAAPIVFKALFWSTLLEPRSGP